MARRKRELLDILREHSKGDTPARPAEPSRRSSPAPSKSDASSSNTSSQKAAAQKATPKRIGSATTPSTSLPMMPLLGLALLVAVVLLGFKYWPEGTADASSEGDSSSVAGVSEEPFSVLVAEYTFSPANRTLAIQGGRALRAQFPELTDTVVLTQFPPEDPNVYELWIGLDPSREGLNDLLRQVQEAQVENQSQNPRPFASASIERRRPIASN